MRRWHPTVRDNLEVPGLTSYFCRFSFSPNSNLSVSSWCRVSQSSLALSLGGRRGEAWWAMPERQNLSPQILLWPPQKTGTQ
jgi:hypothetical protein